LAGQRWRGGTWRGPSTATGGPSPSPTQSPAPRRAQTHAAGRGDPAATHVQVLVQAELGKFVLQVDSEVHVLHRVDDDVDELHAGHLQGETPHVR